MIDLIRGVLGDVKGVAAKLERHFAAAREQLGGRGTNRGEMSPEAMAKLTEANQLDLALYEYFKSAAEKAARAAARHAASRAHGEQAAWEGVTQAPAPELERAFNWDSVRIVLRSES